MNDRINILIVDDEPKNLIVLETVLDDPAYRLFRAESADEALLALVAGEFAVIILDVRMPQMTGFELAQMIKGRKKTAQVPIIFLTAYYNEDQHVLEGYQTGAVDYLHKPVNPVVLRSKVAVFAELHRKTRECVLADSSLLAEVSERRLAEERLEELNRTLEQRVAERTRELSEVTAKATRLVESNIIGVLFADQQRIVDANDAFLAMLGYDRADLDGAGLPWREMTPRESAADDDRALEQLARQGVYAPYQKEFFRKDGSRIPVLIGSAVIEPASPNFVCFVQDLSQIKEAERELREADRRKNEFLATLAHELRNPLAPVRTGLQLMRMAAGDLTTIESVGEMMERQLKQLVRLIDDLMDISRISQGKLKLRTETVSLEQALRSALETVQPLLEEMRHEVALDLPAEPVWIDADLTRLAQIFGNLLSNAAKYSDRGSVVRLSAERRAGEVIVTIEDEGIGIAADQLEHIFGLFSQVDHSLERSHGGLGIGLSLVQRLVGLHGGQIEARSDGLGKGSQFVVRLPAMAQPDRPAGAAEKNDGPAAGALRVLIADDNRDAADCLSLLLKTMGHETRATYDGEQALAAWGTYRPDVVLLDIGMPKLNGYDVCRQIRSQSAGDPVTIIAQTGWGQDEDRQRTREAGFDHHLLKPVVPAELAKLLAEITAALAERSAAASAARS